MHNTKITLDKEKLLFLIALTKTRGKELADACHYSPSYVSKVLSGQRTISGNDEFIKNASLFLRVLFIMKHKEQVLPKSF